MGPILLWIRPIQWRTRGYKTLFSYIKKIMKVSIEETLDDLLVKKRRRTELDVIKNEQLEQQVTLNEIIWDRQRLAAQNFTTIIILYMSATLFFSDSKCTVPWYIMEQIANMQLMRTICWAKAVWQFWWKTISLKNYLSFQTILLVNSDPTKQITKLNKNK